MLPESHDHAADRLPKGQRWIAIKQQSLLDAFFDSPLLSVLNDSHKLLGSKRPRSRCRGAWGQECILQWFLWVFPESPAVPNGRLSACQLVRRPHCRHSPRRNRGHRVPDCLAVESRVVCAVRVIVSRTRCVGGIRCVAPWIHTGGVTSHRCSVRIGAVSILVYPAAILSTIWESRGPPP